MKSVNRKILCKPYVSSKSIKSEVTKGMAMIVQKSTLVGLKVLMDAQVDADTLIKKDSYVYISEEVLHNQPIYQKPLTASCLEEPFVTVDFGHVVFVGEK